MYNVFMLIIVDYPHCANGEELFKQLLEEFGKMFKRKKVSSLLADATVLVCDLLCKNPVEDSDAV